jgi:glycerol uptake facilitator-like aquaporin
LFELAAKARIGPAQGFAEFVAAFGLVVAILAESRFRQEAIPVALGLHITVILFSECRGNAWIVLVFSP